MAAGWDDVAALVAALPQTDEAVDTKGLRSWQVAGRHFVHERPLRKGDLDALAARGDAAPTGPVLAVRVADLDDKERVLAELPAACFTTPHFDGYAAVLVRLDVVAEDDLAELVEQAWLARAPKRVASAYRSLATGGGGRDGVD